MTAIHTFQKCNISNAKNWKYEKKQLKNSTIWLIPPTNFHRKNLKWARKKSKIMRTRKSANAKILRTRTFSVVKSISKYLILPLQIIPFSNRPFFQFYFMVSLFNSFLVFSKFVPFLEIVWNSFFFFQKIGVWKKWLTRRFSVCPPTRPPKLCCLWDTLVRPHTREKYSHAIHTIRKSEYRIII